jgi:hypothetical protein
MATMTFPICELERSVSMGAEKARAEAERVASYSGTVRPSLLITVKLAATTFVLKRMLGSLAWQQSKLIKLYQRCDFTRYSDEEIANKAAALDKIITKERDVLSLANTLGAEIRIWWGASLRQLAEQIEHLDSIAESLHLESDREASLLLGMAVEQFSVAEVKQLALK